MAWVNRNRLDDQFARIEDHHSLKWYKESDMYKAYDASFAVTRNTYARMISLYNYTRTKILNMGEERAEDYTNYDTLLSAAKKDIVSFIEDIQQLDFAGKNDQLYYINDVDVTIDCEELCNRNYLNDFFNVDDLIRHERRVMGYEDKPFYTNKFVDTVATIYKDEIEHFGYKPRYE